MSNPYIRSSGSAAARPQYNASAYGGARVYANPAATRPSTYSRPSSSYTRPSAYSGYRPVTQRPSYVAPSVSPQRSYYSPPSARSYSTPQRSSYSPPAQHYSAPTMRYSAPAAHYSAPATRSYSTPARSYSAPSFHSHSRR
jgi:hypothetical protein